MDHETRDVQAREGRKERECVWIENAEWEAVGDYVPLCLLNILY